MSVQEVYVVTLESDGDEVAEHFDVAARLARFARLTLRWAAAWTMGPSDAGPVVVERPTRREAVSVLAVDGEEMAVVLWDAEGADPRWLSFGSGREDARVYRIELARNAVPLTTMGEPADPHFMLGPQPASAWALALVVIRDHMPREELTRQLAEAAGVPTTAISHASP